MDAAIVARRIAQAQASGPSAQYAVPGRYRFSVDAIKAKDGHRGLSAIAELRVVTAEQTDPSYRPCSVGSVVSFIEKLDDAKKGGPARFKTFLCALVGATNEELDAERVMSFYDESKAPGFGLLIDCEVFAKVLPAKDGNPPKTIESYRWKTVDPSDAELDAIEKKRAAARLPPLSEVLG